MEQFITIKEMEIEAAYYMRILKVLKKGLSPEDWDPIRKINEAAFKKLKEKQDPKQSVK